MATGSARGTWQGGANRAFEYAIVASLVLHAVALLSLPALPSPPLQPSSEPPLEARLMPLQPPAPHPPPHAPVAKPPPVPLLKPPPPPPVPSPALRHEVKKARPVPKRIHRRILKPVQAPSPVHVAPPAPAVSAPPPPAPPPPRVVAAPRAPAPAPAPVASRPQAVPDTASLVAQYRAEIIMLAERYKRYPRFARDNGWEGKVELSLAIGADGAIASLRVSHGSGFSILDRQALEMIRRAEPQARIPAGLRGKAFDIRVPVIFNLREAGG